MQRFIHPVRKNSSLVLALVVSVVFSLPAMIHAGTKPLTFQDLMKFRKIEGAVIARDGGWIAYTLKPDRGDGEAVVRAVEGESVYRIERGSNPAISGDSRWVAAAILPTQKERDKGGDKNRNEDKHKNGMALLSTGDGSTKTFEAVESFVFSEDGCWLAYKKYKEEKKKKKEEKEAGEEKGKEGEEASGTPPEKSEVPKPEEPGKTEEQKKEQKTDTEKTKKKENEGTTVILRNLESGEEIELAHVTSFAFDEPSNWFAYAVAEPGGTGNSLFVRRLAKEYVPPRCLRQGVRGRYTHITWVEKMSRLAFIATQDDEDHEPGPAGVWMWDGGADEPRQLASSDDVADGWMIPSKNQLSWSRDGARLFFGIKPIDPENEDDKEGGENEKNEKNEADSDEAPYDPYNVEELLKKRGVDVWHWNDPFIISNQKKRWTREKDRMFRAVAHVASGNVVRLAREDLPGIRHNDNPHYALGSSDVNYRKEVTWDSTYADVYLVDLETGERAEVARKLRGSGRRPSYRLSPGGRFVAYYRDRHWWLYDVSDGSTRNLTKGLDISFADEDHDYPSPAPGYGLADGVEGDEAVLIHDKFDIWKFPTGGGKPVCITGGEGRRENRRFRVIDLDVERDFVHPDERLLLSSFHEDKKNGGFYETRVGAASVRLLLEEERYFQFIARARDAERILYTRESYSEFPDLWSADLSLKNAKRMSIANLQISEFAWGEAELVNWMSADGMPLQGVLIKPGNYQPGKRYPVLVYFYRFMSQRLHRFNEPVVNHRPSFPVYASNGYAVFLPDVRFEIGRPGLSATKALVPGVQKLVDMGIADPKAIALHGHSWGGYQTAFVITQTNMFAAAVAGAPVSNMTSAYSGIRLGTGLARQFQYEQSQSRIGGTLFNALDKYIENSPVFHAPHIQTPLLIMFGDQDDAVPWQQGVELYLAMRRLGKECYMLQYRGEPHHPRKYANKLDYAIRMKEFFDHHLKGEPAPAWMTEGVPYKGN